MGDGLAYGVPGLTFVRLRASVGGKSGIPCQGSCAMLITVAVNACEDRVDKCSVGLDGWGGQGSWHGKGDAEEVDQRGQDKSDRSHVGDFDLETCI